MAYHRISEEMRNQEEEKTHMCVCRFKQTFKVLRVPIKWANSIKKSFRRTHKTEHVQQQQQGKKMAKKNVLPC